MRIDWDPSFKKNFVLFPLCIYLIQQLCTVMGFYICNVCCVNGKVLVDESGLIKQIAVHLE